ncbi:hypothetical protein [Vallitalea maricola]|uniref:Uncharacterized protein n=1 Tax=Vallitalea maricola TaxID=3074433 RepID=A0ACB5UMP8_9FIRM|nr:hypothetical protein AN2V17_34780 [Vallitalea sp. AN17-2]
MKKQVISLMMAVCLLFSLSLTANAAVKDGIEYYANGYNSSTGRVGGAMYSEEDVDFKIVFKYYDIHHDYIDSETFIKPNTTEIEAYDTPPRNADHVIIKFYYNNKKLDQVLIPTT